MTNTKTRFSKSYLLDRLWAEAKVLEEQFGFDWGHGRVVVEHKNNETKIAFGRYEQLRDLIEDYQD